MHTSQAEGRALQVLNAACRERMDKMHGVRDAGARACAHCGVEPLLQSICGRHRLSGTLKHGMREHARRS